MIDTGATHSFITQGALSTLYHSAIPQCDRIAQLGDGQTTLKIVGEVQLFLQFNKVFTPLNVLVVKTMNTDFILGSDWCTKNAARIDYENNQVSIRSSCGRVFIPYHKSIDCLTLDVKSINVIHIPPRESYSVQAKVELSSADTVYFSPVDSIQSEKSIVISPSLLHINNYTTYLEVYNPHDYSYTLPMNTLLARVTHTPYEMHSCLLFDTFRETLSVSLQHHIFNTIELEQKPSETSNRIDKLITHIKNVQEQQQLRLILQQHMKIFDISKITQANTHIQHTINSGDSLPVSSRPYPRTIEQRRELQDEIQKMTQTNQIRPSNSLWSSPVIIHKKKDGGIRFLVDYRKLNSVTKKDCFPQPTTEDLLHRLGGHRFYTKLNLKSSKANFQVNPVKCSIAVQEIDFLSHTINEQCVKPNGDKIKAIVDLPTPKTLKEANEFLGKINWYRKFIPNFARIAAPLHKVTNKTKHHRHEFKWGPDQQQSFNEFKRLLTTYPLFLEYPDSSTPFVLTTDASNIGIGGILRQDTPNGTKINYFKSRMLDDTERKYDTIEQEALAIFWCLSELRSYIDILPQIIAVKHRPGAHNAAADYISQHFPPSTSTNINPSTTAVTYDDWPIGTEHWDEQVLKPQRTQCTPPSILEHTCTRNASINAEINAVTTRAQSKLQAQPHCSSPNASSTSTTSQSTCSSPPITTPLHDFSLSRIRSEQAQDVIIQQIIQQIRNNRRYESFIIQHGILYKLVNRDDTTIKLVYAPSKLIPEIMTAYHDHPLSNHFGTGRTWSMLRSTYYWPRMKDTVTSYIKSCDKCSQFNVDRRKPPGMDWWGPTTTSLSGNRYVFVITDRLSGYVFAKASPTNTAHDTVRILMEEIILVHGSPDTIITDQGTHFKNELLQAISHLVGCKHIFSTPYHPQTNGQTERWNSTFVTQIAKYCNTDLNNWDTFLSSIVYAYNNGIHSSTGLSPY
ncbi:unnamed protein product [Rotaria sp. Silwood1]|nr:unnamed protein product [Rotaria sp. Silwood1]CAF4860116.1 unnamed protein product [Rotaria sp. Silwood1]CAF4926821.1 unnamed protein product [Rotaria sp. Silwood1]